MTDGLKADLIEKGLRLLADVLSFPLSGRLKADLIEKGLRQGGQLAAWIGEFESRPDREGINSLWIKSQKTS